MKVNFIDSVHPVLSTRLSVAGHTCEDLSERSGDDLLAQLNDSEGLVVRSKMLDAATLAHAPKLKFIARCGAGMENIDRAWCADHGIRLYSSPEGNRDAVAEHAVGMLLSVMNHMPRADREVRGGIWDRINNSGNELGGKTVGIIGFGQMGTAFALRLQGFGVKVIAHDKYRNGFSNEQVEEVSLEELQERSDIISLHLPFTAETDRYADADFFSKCGKPVWFINTARGPLTDTAALLDAIEAGKVLGACLDVLEFEERTLLGLKGEMNNPLLQRLFANENVLLSPHVAGVTKESWFKLSNVLADKILNDFSPAVS
ncbi:MAG: phosphoglycerate dehydrogenase [Flavobacteriales bacterium]|jgi:D-3-phosphoglycerate dehydrogenase|nr:phosphoglycerate dehydrogenase [Flavobacteriales bacterium]